VNLTQLMSALDRKTGMAMDASAKVEWINEAIQAISTERDWPWLDGLDSFNTADGTASYDNPSDWMRTRLITVAGAPAQRIDIADGDAYSVAFDDWRSYYHYALEGNDITFYPTPTAVLAVKHRYVKQEPMLDDGTDTPLMPSQYHQAIVSYAAARVMERMSDPRAQTFDSEYERWKKRMLDATARGQQPTRVRVRAGGGL